MNKKMVFYMIGNILMLEAVLLLIGVFCSIVYRENNILFSFLITAAIAFVAGMLLRILNRTKDKTIFAKEGFAIVSLAWISLSAVGALPFVISGEIPSFTDAFFETVSGFTTTGASILKDVESMSKGLLMWRSFTHWIGGMGVLVLFMALLPTDTGRTIHIMRAEMPGPIIGKLVPKASSTAKILYIIYIALTALQCILLVLGGMPLFDSLIHTFGTAGTGGFGVKSDSLGSYTPYQQWVITIFMLIFGINFNIYYLILMKKFRSVVKSEELWVYLAIVFVAATAIALNIYPLYDNTADTLRYSAFQVATIISTTGYATVDFNLWPTLSKAVLFLLMFTGACAGSTAGGLKVSRVILLFKQVRSHLRHMLHPRSVEAVKLEGKSVDKETLSNVATYFALYFICFGAIFALISVADSFSLETNISATAACFNNIGPGFDAVGPAANYAGYSAVSKWALAFGMLLGRLEILPMLLIFAPSIWFKKRKAIVK